MLPRDLVERATPFVPQALSWTKKARAYAGSMPYFTPRSYNVCAFPAAGEAYCLRTASIWLTLMLGGPTNSFDFGFWILDFGLRSRGWWLVASMTGRGLSVWG